MSSARTSFCVSQPAPPVARCKISACWAKLPRVIEPANAIGAKAAAPEMPHANGSSPVVESEPLVIRPRVNVSMPKRKTYKKVIRDKDNRIAGIEEIESPVEEASARPG